MGMRACVRVCVLEGERERENLIFILTFVVCACFSFYGYKAE